jgi:hypothetical protein
MLAVSPVVLGWQKIKSFLSALLLIFMAVFWFSQGPLATPYCNVVLSGNANPAEASSRLFDLNFYTRRLYLFLIGMITSAEAAIAPRHSDIDRHLHLRAALNTMVNDPVILLVGGGVYSHRITMRREIEKLYLESLPEVKVGRVLYTTGLSAMMVDMGLVGLVLFASNLALVLRALFRRIDADWRYASLLALVLLGVPCWLAVSNIQDIVLYFWMLMPSSILVLMTPTGTTAQAVLPGSQKVGQSFVHDRDRGVVTVVDPQTMTRCC